jgi:hypothetical protein
MPLELTHSTGTKTHFEVPICINCAGDNAVARIRSQHYDGFSSACFRLSVVFVILIFQSSNTDTVILVGCSIVKQHTFLS